jgi:hypothetical protein
MNNRPRLICADGYSISVQASAFHYSTPRENLPEWHWSRFECVEVGYPEDAQGTRIAMPDDWLGYADNPSAGPHSDVFAWVPVQLVAEWVQAHGGLAEWVQAHGGLVADDAPPEATIEPQDDTLQLAHAACAQLRPQFRRLRDALQQAQCSADHNRLSALRCALALMEQALRTVDAVRDELDTI